MYKNYNILRHLGVYTVLMSAVSAAALEPVNAFPVENTILIKHYFDGDAVFDRLKPFYNGTQYRFEVPVAEFESLRRFLRRHGYDVSIVERPAEFYVIVRKYTVHPDDIFKRSVRQESVDGFNCFLMTDQEAVATAVEQGATPFTETPLSLATGTLGDYAPTTA